MPGGGDFWGGVRQGQEVRDWWDNRHNRAAEREARMNQRNALVDIYGPQSGGNVDDVTALGGENRAQQTQDLRVAADERARGIQAQRSGVAVAREILSLPPEQQEEAMNQYAPILGRAFGTSPDDIMQSFGVIRNSQDPLAALEAFDASLASEDERERRMMEESDLEQAAIRANAGLEEARIRGPVGRSGRGSSLTPDQQFQLVGQIESRLANVDNIIDTIDEASESIRGGFLGNAGFWGVLRHLPGANDQRTLAGYIQTIQANLGFDALRAMRADLENQTGGALGQVAVRELEFLQSIVARLDQEGDPETLRQNLTRIRDSYARFRRAVMQDLQRARGDAGMDDAGGGDPAAGGDAGGQQDDPLATFLGRR